VDIWNTPIHELGKKRTDIPNYDLVMVIKRIKMMAEKEKREIKIMHVMAHTKEEKDRGKEKKAYGNQQTKI
jgi:hypothetical protein